MAQNSVKALVLATFSSASVTGSYQAINSSGFAHPVFFLRIVNDSNKAITISYDGINDNEYIAANTTFELPSQTNSLPNAKVAQFNARTIVYLKGTAGAGTIALSGYYV
jgi:hypothetical protein